MAFDFEKESEELADKVIAMWQGHARSISTIDLDEGRAHCHQMADYLEGRLQDEYPDSRVRASVDGHRRIELTKKPR